MELRTGQSFRARDGAIMRIEHTTDTTAAAVITHQDGSRESMLIALEEWHWIVEHEGLIPAGLAA